MRKLKVDAHGHAYCFHWTGPGASIANGEPGPADLFDGLYTKTSLSLNDFQKRQVLPVRRAVNYCVTNHQRSNPSLAGCQWDPVWKDTRMCLDLPRFRASRRQGRGRIAPAGSRADCSSTGAAAADVRTPLNAVKRQ